MKSTLHRQRSGMAMLLVLATVALVTILGAAMLSEATMQAQTGRNVQAGAAGEALAESGVDLACFYLMNPHRRPSLNSSGFWAGGTNLTLGGVPGTFDVTVTSLGSNDYRVTAVGHSTWGTTTGVGRTVSTIAHVDRGLEVKVAAGFTNPLLTLWPAVNVDGDVQVNGVLVNLGTIHGNVVANAVTNLGTLLGGLLSLGSGSSMDIPVSNKVRSYQTYTYAGVQYNATVLGASIAAGATLGPTASNPAGIYYRNGALTIPGNVRINGSLIVDGGPVNVTGGGSVITPKDGFPGAIVKADIYLKGPGTPRNLTVNGLAWVGGSLKSTLVTSGYLTFRGALLMGGGGTVDSTFGGNVNVYPDAELVNGLDVDTTKAKPGVKFKSYSD